MPHLVLVERPVISVPFEIIGSARIHLIIILRPARGPIVKSEFIAAVDDRGTPCPDRIVNRVTFAFVIVNASHGERQQNAASS